MPDVRQTITDFYRVAQERDFSRDFHFRVLSIDAGDAGGISFDEDEVVNGLLDAEGAQSRLFELMKRIRQKEFKKRTLGKCNFEISNGMQIALKFFSTVMPAKKPSA